MSEDKPKPLDKPPTSKLGRLARLAGLAPRALPFAMAGAKRVFGGERTDEQKAAEHKQMGVDVKNAADAMLKTFGEMKGLPLKFGQMASYIDGIAPPGHEERFQAGLKKLLDKAPPLSAEAAIAMVTSELGAPPDEIFAEWEREPFAAASIGQVHRAVTKEGQRVAVKVQYPGMDKAIENDLKSVGMLESMMSPITKKLNAKQALAEFKEVFLSELDYAREAEMADVFRRINAGDPQVTIPRVYHSLTTRRVITLEFIEGMSYAEFVEKGTQEAKNKAGEAIWNFTFRSMLRYGVLYADPHPGNYRFFDDGHVAFLDFGCVKILPPDLIEGMKRYMRAAMDSDWVEFDRACVEVLGFDPKDETWDLYRSYTMELTVPFCSHGVWQCSPEKARETVSYLTRGLKALALKDGETMPSIPMVPKMPQDFTFVNRLQWGLASVLAGLRTEVAFRPLIEPMVRDGMYPIPE